MAGTTYDKGTPENADVDILQGILARLDQVEQRPVVVPVLSADPATTSPLNLWYLYDGRLRGRNPSTGTVVQYQTMTPGSGTSSVARPSPGTPKQQYVK